MSIKEFLIDFNKYPDLKKWFSKPDVLIDSLKELDDMIGMKQIKKQIVQQIKTFISRYDQIKRKGKYCIRNKTT